MHDAICGLALVAAAANVVMQLARLPVGHGVAQSTVDSGRVDKHPIKRLRTTSAFLAVAALGTEERLAMRREINRVHVRGTSAVNAGSTRRRRDHAQTPSAAEAVPFNAYLWDTRRRIRAGKPIV